MNRDELKSLIVGGIATVPTPFDDDFRVDYRRMRDLTEWWVEQGLDQKTWDFSAEDRALEALGRGPAR